PISPALHSFPTRRSSDLSALAVSIGAGSNVHWETAAGVAREALVHLLDAPAPLVFNLNVPNVEPAGLRGLRQARLAGFGAVQTTDRKSTRLNSSHRTISY